VKKGELPFFIQIFLPQGGSAAASDMESGLKNSTGDSQSPVEFYGRL